MPLDEAREIVKPYDVSDVLGILREHGLIEFFFVSSTHIKIWGNSKRRIDAGIFSMEIAESHLHKARERKKK